MRPDVKDYRQGITSREAATRLLAYGPNELPERKPPGLLRIFFQFKRAMQGNKGNGIQR